MAYQPPLVVGPHGVPQQIQSGNTPIPDGVQPFSTRTDAVAAHIPSPINFIITGGYATAGDGGGAGYVRGSSVRYAYDFTSADGSHWQYIPEPDGWNMKAAGVVADGITPDADNVMASWLPFQNSFFVVGGGNLTGTLLVPGTNVDSNGKLYSGVMAIDKPLFFAGGNGPAVKMIGQQQSAAGGPVTSTFQWNPTVPPNTTYPTMFNIYGVNQSIFEAVCFDGISHQNGLVNTIHLNSDNSYIDNLTALVTAGASRTFTVNSTFSLNPNTSLGVGAAGGFLGGIFEIIYIKAVTSSTTFVADCIHNHSVGEQVGGSQPCNNVVLRRIQSNTGYATLGACITAGNGISQSAQIAEIMLDGSNLAGGISFTSVTVSAASPAVVTDTAHGLTLGRPVKFTNNAGTLPIITPAGLFYDATYYIIPIDADHYHLTYSIASLASTNNTSAAIFNTVANAIHWPGHGLASGTPVVFQFDGSIPSTLSGSALFQSQASEGGFVPGGPIYYVSTTNNLTDSFQVVSSPGSGGITFSGPLYGNVKVIAGSGATLINTSGSGGPNFRVLKSHSGFYTFGGGNIKNFFLFNNNLIGFEIAINGEEVSGVLEIFYANIGATSVMDIQANGADNLHVVSVETESSGQRFLSGTGGASDIGATLEQCSYQSGPPVDGYVIKWSGSLTLINNAFLNGAQDGPAVGISPKIQVSGIAAATDAPQHTITASISGTTLNVTAVTGTPLNGNQYVFGNNILPNTFITGAGAGGGVGAYPINNSQTVASEGMIVSENNIHPGGLISIGNFYQFAGPQTPIFYDGGNPYKPGFFPGADQKWRVQQLNDYGSLGTIPASMGALAFMTTSLVTDDVQGSGLINVSQGVMTDGCFTVTIPYTAINSGTTNDIVVTGFPHRTFIYSVIAEVTATFVGAGTSTMKVGTTTGGNELLLSCDVTTATAQFGTLDAEVGSAIARSNTTSSQIGFNTGWSGGGTVMVRFTAGSGNLSALSAGSVTLYIGTRRLN